MITIIELEKMNQELQDVVKTNEELYEKQKDILIKLMHDYQEVVQWHLHKGIIDRHELEHEINYLPVLSEDSDYLYYWNPEDISVRRYDKTKGEDKGHYNVLLFVKNGHFENAKTKILNFETILQERIKRLKSESEKLKSSIKDLQ